MAKSLPAFAYRCKDRRANSLFFYLMFPFFNAAEEIFQSSLLYSSQKFFKMAGGWQKACLLLPGERQVCKFAIFYLVPPFFNAAEEVFQVVSIEPPRKLYQNGGRMA
jgi:hypothetical protein